MVQRIFVQLHECDFEFVPVRVYEAIDGFVRGWQGTHIIECVFKPMSAAQGRSPNGRYSKQAQYFTVQTCRELAEFDRKQVFLGPTMKNQASSMKVKTSVFNSEGDNECSFPEGVLSNITATPRPWIAGPAAKDWTKQSVMWLALQYVHPRFERIKNLFLSTLLVQGTIAQKNGWARHRALRGCGVCL